MDTDINLTWSKPEVFIAKKDNIPWIGKKYKWYVYYYFLNPKTNELEKFKVTKGINKIMNTKQKTDAINNLRKALEIFLSEDYTPFKPISQSVCYSDLWHTPNLKIIAKYVKGKLVPDIKSNWFISYHFLNPKTKKFEYFKVKSNVNDIPNVDLRILALKKERDLLEQKLMNGFNPFDKNEINKKEEKLYSITESQYKYFQLLKNTNNFNSNYPLIFKDLRNEKIFFKFLKDENIIDESHNIIKENRLSPCSHAFYNVTIDSYNKNKNILKKNVEKKDFREFINKHFNTTYTRFSNPIKYESDAQEFFNIDSNFS